MSSNPLQQYFRQPKIYISLPSRGVFNKPGSIQGDTTNLAVYGMTGMDEIIMKTPDALMSGESTARVIASCCPGIKDPWDLSILDTELIFTAIRIATYGNTMGVTHTCSNCSTENDYDIDLSKIVDHLTTCKYENKVVLTDLIIKIQPMNFQQATDLNIRNFALQQTLYKSESMADEVERKKILDDLWQSLADMQNDVYFTSIESIETPSTTVTERNYIIEYIKNCDKVVFDAIKAQIDTNKTKWKFPGFPTKCGTCSTETNVNIELDPSSFFD